MTSEPSNRAPARLRRSRSDRVLGGVCAGIARSIGIAPMLVRLAAVLLAFVSGGTAVVAYLLAWVLLPQDSEEVSPPSEGVRPPAAGSAKEAWTAVGGELKSLAGQMRPSAQQAPPEESTERSNGGTRPSMKSVDKAITAFGDRLRTPEVQEGARRTLVGLSAAVEASVGEIGNRARRNQPEPETGAAPPTERTKPAEGSSDEPQDPTKQ